MFSDSFIHLSFFLCVFHFILYCLELVPLSPPPPVRQNQLNHHAPAAPPIPKSLSGERRQDGPPAGFVYSKSTAHWVCLGVLARAFVPACALAQPAHPASAFWRASLFFCALRAHETRSHLSGKGYACMRECVRVCVCLHIRLISHLGQTNP